MPKVYGHRDARGFIFPVQPPPGVNVDWYEPQEPLEEVFLVTKDEMERDEHHTMEELYRYRMLYHAMFVNLQAKIEGAAMYSKTDPNFEPSTVKSLKHHDGELCFGGGWFIVVTELPTGQISNHYKEEFWDLFNVPAVDLPPKYDGHSPTIAANRMENFVKDHQ